MTKIPQGAFPKDIFITQKQKWSTVNYGMCSKVMKDVYNNYDKYKLKG